VLFSWFVTAGFVQNSSVVIVPHREETRLKTMAVT